MLLAPLTDTASSALAENESMGTPDFNGPRQSTLSFAGDAFAESVVQEGNHYQYRAKHHTRQNAVRRRNLCGVICQHFQNRSEQKYDRREAISLSPEPDANGHHCNSKQ